VEEIIKSLQSGDIKALEEVIVLYQQRIYCYILKMTKNPEDAKDLTQEVFITVYEKIHQYRVSVSFMAWIYKIAKNKTFNYLKKTKVRKYLEISKSKNSYIEPYFDELLGFDPSIESSLDKLSLDEKNILLLKCVEEVTYAELAQIYHLSEATIRKRYERARKKFAKYYDGIMEVENYA